MVRHVTRGQQQSLSHPLLQWRDHQSQERRPLEPENNRRTMHHWHTTLRHPRRLSQSNTGRKLLRPQKLNQGLDSPQPHMRIMATLHRLHNNRTLSLHHHRVIRTSSNLSLVRHSGTLLLRMHLLHHLDNIKPPSRHHYRVINTSSSPCLVLRSRTLLLPMLHPHHPLDFPTRQHLFSKVSVYPASRLSRHPFLARVVRP